MLPSSRRLLQAAVLVAAVGVGYAGGAVGHSDAATPRAGAAERQRGVLDEAADRIAERAVHPVARRQLERAAVEGMLATLGDPWSGYYDASEFASFTDAVEGRYSGVGVWLRAAAGGAVEVGSVQAGSPAASAGVAAGDRVVRVDGHAATSVGAAAALLRSGAPGGSVVLTTTRRGATRSVRLTRTRIDATDVTVERPRAGVLRIAVTNFTRGVGRQVRQALAARPADRRGGVVLDLRGDPGGLLSEGVEVASAFLDGGPVVSYDRRGQTRRTMDALADGDTSTPLVVLVDGRTASAAEVVTGALQDRDRAVVVGSPTYGKSSVQEPVELLDGSAVELTVGRYLTPDGHRIDGTGVQPDVLVRAGSPTGVADGRALDVLSGLQAALAPAGRG